MSTGEQRTIELARDTEVSGEAGAYRATLSRDWELIPGRPNGGYAAALALRAVARELPLARPVSAYFSFLQPTEFGAADIRVETLRRASRTACARVELSQGAALRISGIVWAAAADGVSGYDFQRGEMPHCGPPASGRVVPEGPVTDLPSIFGRIEVRTEQGRPSDPAHAGDPFWRSWRRLKDWCLRADPFVDAARILILADTAATGPLLFKEHKSSEWELTHITPTMDLAVQLYGAGAASEWLLLDASVPVARGGSVCGRVEVWSRAGQQVATVGVTMWCRPNPFLAAPGSSG